jgi:hypothetical protein
VQSYRSSYIAARESPIEKPDVMSKDWDSLSLARGNDAVGQHRINPEQIICEIFFFLVLLTLS